MMKKYLMAKMQPLCAKANPLSNGQLNIYGGRTRKQCN